MGSINRVVAIDEPQVVLRVEDGGNGVWEFEGGCPFQGYFGSILLTSILNRLEIQFWNQSDV